jgi:hypothetical protein
VPIAGSRPTRRRQGPASAAAGSRWRPSRGPGPA